MKLIPAHCVVLILIVTTLAQEDEKKDAIEKINAGLDAGMAILDFLSDENTSKFFKSVGSIAGQIAPFLGAIGPVLSIILMFLPQSESPELQFMKKEFAKIDAKFDQVFDKLEEVKNLIKETSLKNQYSEYEHTILSLSHKLQLFLNQSNHTDNTFKDDFIREYEKTHGGATFKIFNGMMTEGVLSDNIPLTIMEFTNNHRRRTQKVMKRVMNLIMQGVKVILAYHVAKGDNDRYNAQKSQWEDKIKKLVNLVQMMDTKVKNRWKDQLKKDIESELAALHGGSNAYFAKHLYSLINDKFDWRDWHVVAFNDVDDDDYHIELCDGYIKTTQLNSFEGEKKLKIKKKETCNPNFIKPIPRRAPSYERDKSKHGRKVAVASVEQSKESIERFSTVIRLKHIPTQVCISLPWYLPNPFCKDGAAEAIYDSQFPEDLRKGCTIASLGLIKKDADIAHKAPVNRLAKADVDNFQLFAFG